MQKWNINFFNIWEVKDAFKRTLKNKFGIKVTTTWQMMSLVLTCIWNTQLVIFGTYRIKNSWKKFIVNNIVWPFSKTDQAYFKILGNHTEKARIRRQGKWKQHFLFRANLLMRLAVRNCKYSLVWTWCLFVVEMYKYLATSTLCWCYMYSSYELCLFQQIFYSLLLCCIVSPLSQVRGGLWCR